MSEAPSPGPWRRQKASSEASSRGPLSLLYESHLRHMKGGEIEYTVQMPMLSHVDSTPVVTCFKPAAVPQELILSVLLIINTTNWSPPGGNICQSYFHPALGSVCIF